MASAMAVEASGGSSVYPEDIVKFKVDGVEKYAVVTVSSRALLRVSCVSSGDKRLSANKDRRPQEHVWFTNHGDTVDGE